MDLRILELEGNEILWRYHDKDGTTRVHEGKCGRTELCENHFLLPSGVTTDIQLECQQWLNEKPERDKANQEWDDKFEHYSELWEPYNEVCEYAYCSIWEDPKSVAIKGVGVRLMIHGEDGTYDSGPLTNPTWAEVLYHFDHSIKVTGDYHHTFLEGIGPSNDGIKIFTFYTGS